MSRPTHSTALVIQDGTGLNFCGLAQCEGLGSIGTNQTGASSAGLHLHSTFVVTTEGLPLGLLDAQFHAPVSRAADDKRASADIPIEEKKTTDRSWPQGADNIRSLLLSFVRAQGGGGEARPQPWEGPTRVRL